MRQNSRDLFASLGSDGLVNETVRGSAIVIGTQAITFGLTMVTVIVLAHLLTPSDYGVYGLLLIVMNFLLVFSKAGISEAILQSATIDHSEASSLFWFNIVLATAMAGVCAVISPFAAWFFHVPHLQIALCVIGLTFPISALGAQHRALLQRAQRFGATAFSDITQYTCGLIVAIVFAANGGGYWSLIAQGIFGASVGVMVLWLAARWVPGRPNMTSNIKELIQIGFNVTGFQSMNFLGTNVDNILIGRVLGVFQLGLYTRAYTLLVTPITEVLTPLSSVFIVALSRIRSAEPQSFRLAFVSLGTKINLLMIPVMAFLIVNAHDVVRLALGQHWDETATIFAVLGFGGIVEPTIALIGWALVAQVRSRDYLMIGIARTSVMVCGFFLGVEFGVVGVAAAYAVVTCASIVPISAFFGRTGSVGIREVGTSLLPGGLLAVSVGVVSLVVQLGLSQSDAILRLLGTLSASGLVAILLVLLVPLLRSEARGVRALLGGALLK